MSGYMSTRPWIQLLVVTLLSAAPSCTGLRHPTAEDDVSHAAGPPPGAWRSAVAFHLGDSSRLRIEFFDGQRTRLVTSQNGLPVAYGRTPWYRIRTQGAFHTTLLISAEIPGSGVASVVEHPMVVERGFFYEIYAMQMNWNPRNVIIGAQDAKAYPLPQALQRSPADSLWIYWAARDRSCWTCPG